MSSSSVEAGLWGSGLALSVKCVDVCFVAGGFILLLLLFLNIWLGLGQLGERE